MDESLVDQWVCELSFVLSRNVRQFKGYNVNVYKFCVRGSNDHRVTTRSRVCVKGCVYDGNDSNYYRTLLDIIKLYYGCNSVLLFKCEWYNNTRSVRVIQPHGIVEVNHTTRLASLDVYVLTQ